MEDFYEGSLIYDCFEDARDAIEFICEYKDDNLSKCFIAVFDTAVSKKQMTEHILEAVRVMGGDEE